MKKLMFLLITSAVLAHSTEDQLKIMVDIAKKQHTMYTELMDLHATVCKPADYQERMQQLDGQKMAELDRFDRIMSTYHLERAHHNAAALAAQAIEQHAINLDRLLAQEQTNTVKQRVSAHARNLVQAPSANQKPEINFAGIAAGMSTMALTGTLLTMYVGWRALKLQPADNAEKPSAQQLWQAGMQQLGTIFSEKTSTARTFVVGIYAAACIFYVSGVVGGLILHNKDIAD